MTGSGTLAVHVYTLPDESTAPGTIFAAATAYRPPGARPVQCCDCGAVNSSEPADVTVFVRDSDGSEALVIDGVVDSITDHRPEHVVAFSRRTRDVLRDRAAAASQARVAPDGGSGGVELLFDVPGVTWLTEESGGRDESALYRSVGVDMEYPELRGSLITHSEVRRVGAGIVRDSVACEVAAVESFAAAEVTALLRAFDRLQ